MSAENTGTPSLVASRLRKPCDVLASARIASRDNPTSTGVSQKLQPVCVRIGVMSRR